MSNQKILDQACQWLAKINSPNDYNAEEFSLWLAQDEEHEKVFNEVSNNWQQLKLLNAKNKPALVNSKTRYDITWFSIAACIVFVCIGLFVYPEPTPATVYQNQASHTHQVTLSDNSQVLLNAKSTITTHFNNKQRLITLEQGDAQFIVAKDPERPFVVQYKHNGITHQFTALGTAFTVTTRGDMMIFVTEHSVAVTSDDKHYTLQQQHALRYKHKWQPISLAKARDNIAWQQGRIIFNNQPINKVLTKLRPHVKKPIRLINLGIQNELVSGNFELANAGQALEMIALGLNLKIKDDGNQLVLY